MILLLTGESGSGKTRLCARVIGDLKNRGMNITGVLTQPRLVNGEKVGMDLEDVRTAERWALADRIAKGQGTDGLGWKFETAGLARGEAILRAATPCDVLVIDELGPLELVHSRGWVVALDVLRANKFDTAIVVIRPSLISEFKARVRSDIVLSVMASNREELFEQIIHDFERRIHTNSHKSKE
jgi:nucleoside-triphosphatase THEP1